MADATETQASPKRTRKPRADNVTLDTVIRQIANKRGEDARVTGKGIRGAVRANRPRLEKFWPTLRKHERNVPYKLHPMPRNVAVLISKHGVAGALSRLEQKS